ncbi:MAG: flavodoxin family protein [Candidatus Heimdallarchaeota archaeon]|nr:flavodoxin family protein [Candidatus Heimdallarchaeota archaeon]
MKIIIVYDSVYGNTERIAQAIGTALTSEYDVKVARAANITIDQLTAVNILFVGSPTHGGRFTKEIQDFLNDISKLPPTDIKIATFDTRTSSKGIARRIEKLFGHAAIRIAKAVKTQGKILIGEPEGFIVKGTKGPLRDGELERAESWGKKIIQLSDQTNI